MVSALLTGSTYARWSLHIASDAFTDGRRFKVLAVVDDVSRECLTMIADTALSALRVTREPDALIGLRGKPITVVSANGTDLTSMAVRFPSEPDP